MKYESVPGDLLVHDTENNFMKMYEVIFGIIKIFFWKPDRKNTEVIQPSMSMF